MTFSFFFSKFNITCYIFSKKRKNFGIKLEQFANYVSYTCIFPCYFLKKPHLSAISTDSEIKTSNPRKIVQSLKSAERRKFLENYSKAPGLLDLKMSWNNMILICRFGVFVENLGTINLRRVQFPPVPIWKSRTNQMEKTSGGAGEICEIII